MISIVLTGRNDDHGGAFSPRLFRACAHNSRLLCERGIAHEWLLVEWNPPPGRPLLAEALVARLPYARAVVVPPDVHAAHVSNPSMPFDEMAAKNVGIRRANGEWILVTNADILFDPSLVDRLTDAVLRPDTLYRAHRIDVPSGADDTQLQEGSAQIESSDGRLQPCYYLGAGGDFCLAHAALFHRLQGFNERVRFSTRAKDWQFYLSAAMQGVQIEFLGRVFHLDHDDGFRKTPASLRDTSRAHFGGPWDLEFGLPPRNPDDWGYASLAGRSAGDERIRVLAPDAAGQPRTPPADLLAEWLAAPSDGRDPFSPRLLHAIDVAARTRIPLTIRTAQPRQMVAAAGMAAVAAAFGIEVACPWEWPPLPGLTPPSLRASASQPGFEFTSSANGCSLRDASGQEIDAEPRTRPIGAATFNPMLGRRLLRAFLDLRKKGAARIALYGAGGHTRELLRWGVPDDIQVAAVLVSGGPASRIDGLPVVPIHAFDIASVDAVVLSSNTHEPEMSLTARELGFRWIVPLWSDWPRRFWSGVA